MHKYPIPKYIRAISDTIVAEIKNPAKRCLDHVRLRGMPILLLVKEPGGHPQHVISNGSIAVCVQKLA